MSPRSHARALPAARGSLQGRILVQTPVLTTDEGALRPARFYSMRRNFWTAQLLNGLKRPRARKSGWLHPDLFSGFVE
jgi:hypothetical protein